MWLFLFSEVLFFSGLFLLYLAYRSRHPDGFRAGAAGMQVALGTANTLVLLTGSAAAAVAVADLEGGRTGRSALLQAATALLGLVFLGVKALEWRADILAGFYPGAAAMAGRSHGEQLFCSLYFMMTGVHGLHVLAGTALFGASLRRTLAGRVRPGHGIFLENTGLFWHLVDVVWIYLWPLLYLVR